MSPEAARRDADGPTFKYPHTPQQVIAWLSSPEAQAWLQNVQTQFARGELHPNALGSIEEFDAFVAES